MGEALAIESPSKHSLAHQLSTVRFLSGVERGRWRVLLFDWPNVYVRVTGRDPDSNRTFTHDFHLECTGYPDPGPFVERWAFTENSTHGSVPPPPTIGSPGFMDAMKEWSGGIYRAWNRQAATHNDWATKRPADAWNRQREVIFILEHLYALVTEQAVWLASQP